MVSACAGCDSLEPWAACIIGIGAGISFVLVAAAVVKLKVDDPLDAVGGGLGYFCCMQHMMNIFSSLWRWFMGFVSDSISYEWWNIF